MSSNFFYNPNKEESNKLLWRLCQKHSFWKNPVIAFNKLWKIISYKFEVRQSEFVLT